MSECAFSEQELRHVLCECAIEWMNLDHKQFRDGCKANVTAIVETMMLTNGICCNFRHNSPHLPAAHYVQFQMEESEKRKLIQRVVSEVYG